MIAHLLEIATVVSFDIQSTPGVSNVLMVIMYNCKMEAVFLVRIRAQAAFSKIVYTRTHGKLI